MNPERDDYDEDDEREEFASRSIFAAGWFRAVLVLTVLAIVVVVSLPYLLNWFEPAPPPARTAGPVVEAPRSPVGVERPAAPAPATAPTTPTTPPQPAVPPTSAPRSAPASPPAAAPAPKAAAEKPAASRAVADKPAAPGTPKSSDRAGSPTAVAKAPASGGGYWVQLGVFKDARNAESLAKTVRDQGFPVEVARVSRTGAGGAGTTALHEIFVSEAGVEKVNAALKGKGSAQPAPGGVVVKPSFALQEAMTVSKQLSGGGLKVVVRPAGSAGQPTHHVVRAGGYADRGRALAALGQIKQKGHEGFVTQGPAR